MKKLLCSLIAACAILNGTAFAQTQKGETMPETPKILIAYYSKTGNTEQIAKLIQNTVGGDLLAIEPVSPYPDDYDTLTTQAKKEISESKMPPIKKAAVTPEDYDIIFVGSPCWWSTIAPPVATFLSEHDFSAKTVIPFSTHGGSGLADNARDTAKLTPQAKHLPGKAFYGSRATTAGNDVKNWLKELGF